MFKSMVFGSISGLWDTRIGPGSFLSFNLISSTFNFIIFYSRLHTLGFADLIGFKSKEGQSIGL